MIWFDRSAADAFAFIEIKPPGKIEDTRRIPEVASRLKVNFAITWDFTEAVLYHVAETLEVKKVYPTGVLAVLDECSREDKRILLRKCLRDFLGDLRELQEKGHLHRFPPDKYFFIKLLNDSTEKLYGYFQDHLGKAMQRKQFAKDIDAFLAEQGIPNLPRPDIHELLTRQWVYGLITKILFYLTVRRHFPSLPDIIEQSRGARSLDSIIRKAFKKARDVDWHAVFEEDNHIEKIGIPKSCDEVLAGLLERLGEYNFSELGEDVIGEVFESLIPENEKHRLGQYFTREDLVDFIIGFVVQSSAGQYIDPTCGSGTFLNRIYSRLKRMTNYSKKHTDLLSQIWGIDIAKFPAELATINLFRQEIHNYANFPRVKVADFFDLRPGQELEFRLPKPVAKGVETRQVKLPLFTGMAGNFPFIRQEQIEKKKKGYKDKLTRTIALDWFREYPDVFRERKKIRKSELENSHTLDDKNLTAYVDNLVREKHIDLELSGQADMYAYLFLHTAKFLGRDGRMGFITSNSWLDVSYGYVLKKFFLDHFRIVAVVCSWAEPWFHFASVNTVFTILERCDDAMLRNENYVRFVKVKKKLEELIPYRDLELEETKRWDHIDTLVGKIERCRAPEGNDPMSSVEDEDFRIRLVKQEYLLNELEREKQFSKWGKYLRAPDVYFEILKKAKSYFVPLKDLLGSDIRFGIKTGINDFFYLEPTGEKAKRARCLNVKNSEGKTFDIETRFLKPVIKSPKEADKIILEPKKLRYRLFMCNLSKAELRKLGYRGALKYIEWGERQKTKGIRWPDVPSVKDRRHWWALGERVPGSILMQMVNNDRFLVFLNDSRVQVDHNLFELLVPKEEVNVIAALLNGVFTALNREVISRVNLGDGATKTEGVDWKNNVFLFDHSRFSKKDINRILKSFSKLLERPIDPIHKEIRRKDRQEFDKAILEAMGLVPDKYLKPLYKGLTELVHERLALPKMRKKIANAKVEVSIEEIKRQVEQEIIPNGLRDFPGSFLEQRARMKYKEIAVTGLPMRIGHHFFGKYEVVDEVGGVVYEADSLEVARYIICSFKPDEHIIRIPKSRIAVTKAVTSYQRYIRNIHERLLQRAFSATQEHDTADRIAIELLRENGYTGNFELG